MTIRRRRRHRLTVPFNSKTFSLQVSIRGPGLHGRFKPVRLGPPITQVVFGVVEDLARLRPMLVWLPFITRDQRRVVEERE